MDDDNKKRERKVQSIVLAHLYLKKRELQEKVSLKELEVKVSLLDKSYIELDLIKLFENSDLVKVTEDNQFIITKKGMEDEEGRIKENNVIE